MPKAQGSDIEVDAPVIKLADLLFSDAITKRASDIHIEPFEDTLRIRYRIDGMLNEVPSPPKTLQGALISRIKIMANMDIAEKRLPQDGRIRFTKDGKELDVRVSSIPATYGESIVMRLLDKSNFSSFDLDKLGFSKEDRERFTHYLSLPNGIILVTGPTGSGKTTTLYAALRYLNKSEKKLISVEDPVEYQLEGINQVQVKPQIGLTFAAGLRSMLRQAPDIIMVGEIRDYETASVATQAALTGHLILSTLHTNDAPSSITRLIDMGVAPYLAASTIQAVLAQRLIRVLCEKCKQQYTPSPEEVAALDLSDDELKRERFWIGEGCVNCNNTGYRGRIGIFELLTMDDSIRHIIFEKVSSSDIRTIARKSGMRTLMEDGRQKVLAGITSVSEVIRATVG